MGGARHPLVPGVLRYWPMTSPNGRDQDLDPEREHPRVVPLRGWEYPAPPDWDPGGILDAAVESRHAAAEALGPDDLTSSGRPRCTYLKQRNSDEAWGTSPGFKPPERCDQPCQPGSDACGYHDRKYRHQRGPGGDARLPHPDDASDEVLAPSKPGNPRETRADRVERIRLHLELVASSAVLAVQSVLESESARPQDRLKAAEIVLDRTVGRQLQLEAADQQERDLDVEILQLADTVLPPLAATGTDGQQ